MERKFYGITYKGYLHTNGGGFVKEGIKVPDPIYVGPEAAILGGTIEGGTIEGGTIWGGTIEGGTIRGGTIEGGTICGGTIWGGTIRGGTIWGGTIEGGTIWGGTIEGGTIWGGTIEGGTIWGGTICGGTIEGGTVSKDVTFICGSIPYPVTITDTHCGVGCKWHTHKHWLDKGEDIMESEREGYASKYLPLLLKTIRLHQES